jgi:hypothetical protein
MKSTIVQEMPEIEHVDDDKKNLSDGTLNNQPSLSAADYPKNIEHYIALLRALYENSSLLNHRIQAQPCEMRFESFKENIVANQLTNNAHSNQQGVPRKNTKTDSDDAVGSERSLGNIIIKSLDVSINVAGKTEFDCGGYGNINKLRISCSTKKTVSSPLASPDTQQLVTSSSDGDDEETGLSSSPKNENNNHNINDGPTRAVYGERVETGTDDISFDYHKIKHHNDDDKHTTSTTCNNNSTKYPNGDDDAGDYRTKDIVASIDVMAKSNKHNNSSGDIKPITSTYLLMTRSMGLTDEDALNLVSEEFFVFVRYLKDIFMLNNCDVL